MAALTAFAAPSVAAQDRPPEATRTDSPYAPFEFLIGDWSSPTAGGGIRQTFRWGPRQSYISVTTLQGQAGRPESIHFEGMALWNGATNRLDYLYAVEPGSGAQERGEIYAQADGLIVRDVILTDRNGRSERFRQTFQRTGEDSAITSVMRQTATGWEPTFPGGERLVMTRRRS